MPERSKRCGRNFMATQPGVEEDSIPPANADRMVSIRVSVDALCVLALDQQDGDDRGTLDNIVGQHHGKWPRLRDLRWHGDHDAVVFAIRGLVRLNSSRKRAFIAGEEKEKSNS